MSIILDSPVKALFDSYNAREKEGIISVPLAWKEKLVSWVVKLNTDGTVRGKLVPFGNKNDIQQKKLILPELLFRTNGTEPSLASDTLKYLSNDYTNKSGKMKKEAYWDAWRERHFHFHDPMNFPDAVVKFLRGSPPLTGLTGAEWAVMENGGKNIFIVELPDGTFLHELDSVKSFWGGCNKIFEWQNFGKDSEDQYKTQMGYSSVSGEWTALTPFHAPIGFCIPRAQSGAKIGSIHDAPVYHSYGREGGFCVPMTLEESLKMATQIRDLANAGKGNKSTTISLGNPRKYSVWKKCMEESKAILLAWGPETVRLFDPFSESEEVVRNKAIEIIRYVTENQNSPIPDIEEGDQVHFLMLSAAMSPGRVAINEYWHESAPDFARRMAKWYDCTMLYDNDGNPTYAGISQLVSTLGFHKVRGKISEGQNHAYRQVQVAITRNDPIPVTLKERAGHETFKKIVEGEASSFGRYDSPARMFRACRIREGVQYKKGSYEMQNKTPAYCLGVLVIETDDAKQYHDLRRGHTKKGLGTELTKESFSIIRECESHPASGLAMLRKRLISFNQTNKAIETNDGRFDSIDNAKNHVVFSRKDRNDFIAGLVAGLDIRKKRIEAAREAKQLKALQAANSEAQKRMEAA